MNNYNINSLAVSLADDFLGGPSSSSSYRSSSRMLDLFVQHGDDNHFLRVPDSIDVLALKGLLQKETGCPPCKQDIKGFKGSRLD